MPEKNSDGAFSMDWFGKKYKIGRNWENSDQSISPVSVDKTNKPWIQGFKPWGNRQRSDDVLRKQ